MSSLTSLTIRPVRRGDDPALARICLLTGNAGSSAEDSYSIPELLGQIHALPYNRLETTFGYVLVEDEITTQGSAINNGGDVGRVVGYILGTVDSRKFAEIAERDWWPQLRKKYPKEDLSSPTNRTQADQRCVSIFHSPSRSPEDLAARIPAHIHINILPSYQRKSYGRKLMAAAVNFLKANGHRGLFVGLDPLNEAAKKFYDRVGFERIERDDGEWWELAFDRFCG